MSQILHFLLSFELNSTNRISGGGASGGIYGDVPTEMPQWFQIAVLASTVLR